MKEFRTKRVRLLLWLSSTVFHHIVARGFGWTYQRDKFLTKTLRPKEGHRESRCLVYSRESDYYTAVDRNETVDYFGESTWSDLVLKQNMQNLCTSPSDIAHSKFHPVPPPEERVFCSRTLNLRAIKAIGFVRSSCHDFAHCRRRYDMDYTVVQYKWRKWEELAYECTKSVLAGYGFPVKDLYFDDPELVCRGLVIDKEYGNFLKLDRHGFVRRAMHGYTQLAATEIDALYGRIVIDLRETSRFLFLNTLFSVSEGVLYAQLVHKLDTGALMRDAVAPFDPSKVDTYASLHRAVSKALARAHTHGTSSLKARVVEDPSIFTQRESEKLRTMLEDQRAAGKYLALITNSDWWYTDTMMRFVMGDDSEWRQFFDIVFVSARKPSFFTRDRLPCYELVVDDDRPGHAAETDTAPLLREMFEPKFGGVYCGGSAYLVEKLFGLSDDDIMYVGDHVLHDVNSVKSTLRWRTALVVQELATEISAFRAEQCDRAQLDSLLQRKDELSVRLNHLRCQLRRWEVTHSPNSFVVDENSADNCRRSIASILSAMNRLDDEIGPRLRKNGAAFNEYWGYISRTGQDKSIYQRMIEKNCDIYTSQVVNLVAYTPYHYFRAAPQALAHEPPNQYEDFEHDLLVDDCSERYI